MHIKEVISKTGLTRKQIHFYIDKELLDPVHDSDNNYLDFSQQDVDQLILIRKLRSMDLSINDIRQLLEFPAMTNFILHKQYHQILKNMFEESVQLSMISNIIDNSLPRLNVQDINRFDSIPVDTDKIRKTLGILYPSKDIRALMIILWANFVAVRNSEYRLFLWDKLVNEAGRLQISGLDHIIDYLYCINSKDIIKDSSLRYRHSTRLINSDSREDLEQDRNTVREEMKQLIRDPEPFLINYPLYIRPLYEVYTSSLSNIMISYHTGYKKYIEKTKQVCELLKQDNGFLYDLKFFNETHGLDLDPELLLFYTFDCGLYK